MVLIFKISECLRKIAASFEGEDKAMKSQNESYTSPRRLSGYSVHPNTTSESTEVTTGNRSKELFMECSGNETVIDSSNTSIRNPINEFTTQFRENETVIESANSSIGNPSNEPLLQSRGSETITESANASIANRINNVPMQLIEHKRSGESFGANVGNCSRYIHSVTGREDVTALIEETQETVQSTVGKYLRNKSWKPECVGSFNMDWRILVCYLEAEARDKIY
jgi:hypothetical protein